jgi:diguanylate cyclase (GGDEF)-like protein/PAS domain S-box-containing protein
MTMGTRMLPGWGAEGGGDAAKVVHTGDLLNLHTALAAALDACPTALVVLDAEQHFLRVNAAACAFLGRTHDDLLGVCAVDLLAPEMTIEDETGLDLATTALDPAAEPDWCFEKPDHSLVWGRVRNLLLGDRDGLSAARLTMIDDVTEEHRAQAAERALMGDLHRYQRMFEGGSIGQTTVAMPGYRIATVNQAFADVTGCTRDEVVGAEGDAFLMHGAPWDVTPNEHLENGEVDSYVVERGLTHRDGHLVPVVDTVSAVRTPDGVMTHLSVLTIDLTTQRAAEHARLDSAMVLAAVASSQVIVTTFDRDLRFTFLAEGGMTRRGRVDSDFVGRDAHEVVTDALTVAAMKAALDGQETTTKTAFNGRMYANILGPLRSEVGDVVGVISISSDVTVALAAEAESRHNRALLDAVLSAFPMLVASFDAGGRLIEGAGRLFEANDPGGQVGHRLDDGGSPSLAAPLVDRAIAGEEVTATIERDGSFYLGVYRPNLDADGVSMGALAVITDVTERQRATELALHVARHDPMTGLPLRATLIEHLNGIIGIEHRPCVALLMDVDDLQVVNEALGHDAGDAVLVRIASSLVAAFPGMMVARVGGDEFVVSAPDITRDDPIDELVSRVCTAMSTGHADHLDVHASMGVAYADPDGSAETLLRHADSALYQAKHAGRGQTCVFDADLRDRRQQVRSTEVLLRGALAVEALHVEYQPIVSLATRRVVGVEALARWTDATRGVITPSEFIPVAESSGLIVPIGNWVMQRSCDDAVALSAGTTMPLHVNVAARQLRDPGFVAWVKGILDRSGLPYGALTIEITESALFDDVDLVRVAFEQLRDCGVRVALDDFGTGFSSLSRLQDMPVDIIKLDRAFVIDVASSVQARRMAGAILALSRAIGASIVAEGIETEEQASVLADLGYESAQGFLFARPMRLKELCAFVGRAGGAEAALGLKRPVLPLSGSRGRGARPARPRGTRDLPYPDSVDCDTGGPSRPGRHSV